LLGIGQQFSGHLSAPCSAGRLIFIVVFFTTFSKFVCKYWDIYSKVHGCFHKSYLESFIYLCDSTAFRPFNDA
jgi:hypothetical protein